jgi:hypothetical protein
MAKANGMSIMPTTESIDADREHATSRQLKAAGLRLQRARPILATILEYTTATRFWPVTSMVCHWTRFLNSCAVRTSSTTEGTPATCQHHGRKAFLNTNRPLARGRYRLTSERSTLPRRLTLRDISRCCDVWAETRTSGVMRATLRYAKTLSL